MTAAVAKKDDFSCAGVFSELARATGGKRDLEALEAGLHLPLVAALERHPQGSQAFAAVHRALGGGPLGVRPVHKDLPCFASLRDEGLIDADGHATQALKDEVQLKKKATERATSLRITPLYKKTHTLLVASGCTRLEAVSRDAFAFVELLDATGAVGRSFRRDDAAGVLDKVLPMVLALEDMPNPPRPFRIAAFADLLEGDSTKPEKGVVYYCQQVERELKGGFGLFWLQGTAPARMTDGQAFKYFSRVFESVYRDVQLVGSLGDQPGALVPVQVVQLETKRRTSSIATLAVAIANTLREKQLAAAEGSRKLASELLAPILPLRKLSDEERAQLRPLAYGEVDGVLSSDGRAAGPARHVDSLRRDEPFDKAFGVHFSDTLGRMVKFLECGGEIGLVGGDPEWLQAERELRCATARPCHLCGADVGRDCFLIHGIPVAHGFHHYCIAHNVWPSRELYAVVQRVSRRIANAHVQGGM